MKIKVTREIGKKAGHYKDGEHCLLATAIKEAYPSSIVKAGVTGVKVDEKYYKIDNHHYISGAYTNDELRVRKNFKEFEVTLEEYALDEC